MRFMPMLAAAFAALLLAPAAAAQTHGGLQPGEVANPVNRQVFTRRPQLALPVVRQRYIITAQRFHANDETGPDWPGSDEVYAVFDDLASGQRRFTKTFGNIDTGDTQSIAGNESCIGPLPVAPLDSHGYPPSTWACQGPGLTGRIAFNIALYEADGWSPMACAGNPNITPSKKNCDDDLIGSLHREFTEAALRLLMPNVNDIHDETARVGGYTVTFRIQRLSDTTDELQNRQ